jgi:hypothetical protein
MNMKNRRTRLTGQGISAAGTAQSFQNAPTQDASSQAAEAMKIENRLKLFFGPGMSNQFDPVTGLF